MKAFLFLTFTFLATITFSQTDTIKYCVCHQPDNQVVNGEQALTIVQKMPKFPGGDEAMAKFIKKNLEYPKKYDKWQGNVYVSFVIDTVGNPRNICVLRGQLNSTVLTENDKAAVRVIYKMPQWNPGMQNGHKVMVTMITPIKFR